MSEEPFPSYACLEVGEEASSVEASSHGRVPCCWPFTQEEGFCFIEQNQPQPGLILNSTAWRERQLSKVSWRPFSVWQLWNVCPAWLLHA